MPRQFPLFHVKPSFLWASSLKTTQSPRSYATASHATSTSAFTPAVLRLLHLNGISDDKAKSIPTSGPKGRLLKGDVLFFLSGKTPPASSAAAPKKSASPSPTTSAKPPPPPVFGDIPLTNMRRVIAKRLLESKRTTPHLYISQSIKLDNLLKWRETFNNELGKNDKLSVNDYIIKAAAFASESVPQVNNSFVNGEIKQNATIDISVAVATDSGLITPIVFAANHKGVLQISKDIKALSKKARDNKLMPHEYQGGTLTVSNLGMFGIKEFTAIINPPQASILAVGGTTSKIIPSDSAKGFSSTTEMVVNLCSDRRVVEEVDAAKWVQIFKEILEDPQLMLN